MKIKWNKTPSPKDLRVFGVVIGVGFPLLSLLLWRGGHATAALWMAGVSVGVMTLALAAPVLARPFYFLWMGFAVVMGTVVSKIILAVIFFGVFTPLSLLFRLKGRDALKIKKPSGGSYWEPHPVLNKAEDHKHLF